MTTQCQQDDFTHYLIICKYVSYVYYDCSVDVSVKRVGGGTVIVCILYTSRFKMVNFSSSNKLLIGCEI